MSDFETWIAGKKAAVRYDTAGGWWMAPHAMRELVARAEKAEAQVQRVREVCEQQMKDRSPWSDDREKYGLDRIDGWNDALDIVEQALDGGDDE